ncbi:MAG: ogt 2 [Sporomusa sp.]|nr:ogt 2 [Sporomusa sp.]
MVRSINLYSNTITTAWGPIAAVWSDAGLWELGFPRADEKLALADIRAKEVVRLEEGHDACFWAEQLADELKLYFQGFPVSFAVPVDWRFYSPFQTSVLKYTADIPYGKTVSMHSNRTPLVVPCHRVVGSNGSLTGFGGGVDMKKALLLLECSE